MKALLAIDGSTEFGLRARDGRQLLVALRCERRGPDGPPPEADLVRRPVGGRRRVHPFGRPAGPTCGPTATALLEQAAARLRGAWAGRHDPADRGTRGLCHRRHRTRDRSRSDHRRRHGGMEPSRKRSSARCLRKSSTRLRVRCSWRDDRLPDESSSARMGRTSRCRRPSSSAGAGSSGRVKFESCMPSMSTRHGGSGTPRVMRRSRSTPTRRSWRMPTGAATRSRRLMAARLRADDLAASTVTRRGASGRGDRRRSQVLAS